MPNHSCVFFQNVCMIFPYVFGLFDCQVYALLFGLKFGMLDQEKFWLNLNHDIGKGSKECSSLIDLIAENFPT